MSENKIRIAFLSIGLLLVALLVTKVYEIQKLSTDIHENGAIIRVNRDVIQEGHAAAVANQKATEALGRELADKNQKTQESLADVQKKISDLHQKLTSENFKRLESDHEEILKLLKGLKKRLDP
jgi:hypothetical protein